MMKKLSVCWLLYMSVVYFGDKTLKFYYTDGTSYCSKMTDKRMAVCWAHHGIVAIVLAICCAVFPNNLLHYYFWTAYFILYVIIVHCTYPFSKLRFLDERIRPNNKAVLITGCDTGFGNQLARRLDSKGFHVFASCLFPDAGGAADLRQDCSDRLRVVQLDVTKDESVEKALSFVKDHLGSNVLWSVVNNAGVLRGISTDFTPLEDYKVSMEVNAFGMVRVTKAFLQLLKKSKGRVVNITSLAGRLPAPMMGAYAMSKYAAVAFTECLRLEMKAWGVCVISIEPEFFNTPMICEENAIRLMDELFSTASDDIKTSYGEVYLEKLKKMTLFIARTSPRETHIVIDDIEAAVTHKYPDSTYKPRRNILTRVLLALLSSMPYDMYGKLVLFLAPIVVGYPRAKDIKELASH